MAQFDRPEEETDILPLLTEMVGSCLPCLSCFFTCSSVLLLVICLRDAEASGCQRVIHKKVGDTVELSSCSPTEGLTIASWRYEKILIADKDYNISAKEFEDRLYLNPTNFSLTVRDLTLQDSGNFSFFSGIHQTQIKPVIVTLQVHEPITKQPVLTSNSTWHTMNESCTVFLECSATTDSRATYKWTVENQTIGGSRLKYTITEQDGGTKFTCTIGNFVSEASASKVLKCSNETEEASPTDIVIILSAAGTGCLVIVIVGIVLGVCYCKKSQPGSDLNDLTVYADITEVANQDETPMKPCSVYETIERVKSEAPGPQTVYDKIQFSRMKTSSAH